MKYEEFTTKIQEIIPELKKFQNLEEVKELPYQFFWEFFESAGAMLNQYQIL